jgi:hypothetical protein
VSGIVWRGCGRNISSFCFLDEAVARLCVAETYEVWLVKSKPNLMSRRSSCDPPLLVMRGQVL